MNETKLRTRRSPKEMRKRLRTIAHEMDQLNQRMMALDLPEDAIDVEEAEEPRP